MTGAPFGTAEVVARWSAEFGSAAKAELHGSDL
jgi:hypothetical protein